MEEMNSFSYTRINKQLYKHERYNEIISGKTERNVKRLNKLDSKSKWE